MSTKLTVSEAVRASSDDDFLRGRRSFRPPLLLDPRCPKCGHNISPRCAQRSA